MEYNEYNIENKKRRKKRLKKLLKRKRRDKRMNYINNLKVVKVMSQIDDKLFLKIFKDNRKGYFKSFMKLMSRLGDGYVWAFLYFARAITAAFICIFVFLYIKNFFSRMRPYKKHDKIPIMYPPDKHSFPSGHTMVGFAISFSIGSYGLGSAILFYTIASLIAFSRIYVGLHYPLDVVCGIVFGTIIGVLTNIVFFYMIGLPIMGHI